MIGETYTKKGRETKKYQSIELHRDRYTQRDRKKNFGQKK